MPETSTVSFEGGVLPRELELIQRRRAVVLDGAPVEDAPRQASLDADPVQAVSPCGLAFSGGGIRSATFNLGILQGLAEKGFLRYVDYLSTVSGGGYIGSWFHGLIRNQGDAIPAKKKIDNIETLLSPSLRPVPGPPDEDPITFLRKYSNYLAPRQGLFRADTWVIGFIWVRNVLLNQLIIAPAIAALAALALIAIFVKQVRGRAVMDPLDWGFNLFAGIVAGAALVAAGVLIARNLRPIARQSVAGSVPTPTGYEQETEKERRAGPRGMVIVLLVFAATVALGSGYFRADSTPVRLGLVVVCILVTLLIQGAGGFVDCYVAHRPGRSTARAWALFNVVFMSVVTGLLAAALVMQVWTLAAGWHQAHDPWKHVIFGPPLVSLGLIVSVMLLVGLMGADYPDAAREWTARVGAMLGIATAAWTVLLALMVLGPWAISWLLGNFESLGTGAVGAWLLTSVGGALAGRSGKTDGSTGTGTKRALEVLASVAPTVFLVGYVIAISAGVHLALESHVRPFVSGEDRVGSSTTKRYDVNVKTPEGADVEVRVNPSETGWLAGKLQPVRAFAMRYPEVLVQEERGPSRLAYTLLLLTIFALVAAVASKRVNINEFSLHHFYKNRLVRAYLGASRNRIRRPNSLTGFDPRDDFPIATLTPDPAALGRSATQPYPGPYALVNATLNLNAGSELAQQERKATSFIFTPAFCGFNPAAREARRNTPPASGGPEDNGYCPTRGYASPAGPDIGTTTAISGAAANPNWGYHTSGPMAFLLTVFNARLGWWLGNPRWPGPSTKPGPTFALKYLFAELLGQTTARTKFVNLSDGGHFDNLGLYELVRRRCRFIIVCDAEQDHGLTFGSLGAAIRKCRADFGVEIDINPDPIRRDAAGFSGTHCVVGTIVYPGKETAFAAGLTTSFGTAAERPGAQARGWLVYLKSSLTGDEPADVVEYRSRCAAFPHESTADQFFSESQFESYRRLGLHVCRAAFDGVALPSMPDREGTPVEQALRAQYPLVRTFQDLTRKWYAPIPVTPEAATRLADAYVAIMRRLAEQASLKPLYLQLVDKDRKPAGAPGPELVAFGMELVQLMQNVYTEFKLEDDFNQANPKNAGWISVFREWVLSELLYDGIWPKIENDYHPLFRRFIRGLRDNPPPDVPVRW